MGGSDGGVNRPERLWRRGELRGDTGHGCDFPPAGGDIVQGLDDVAALLGGEVPQADPALDPLDVRRRWGTGGVPIVNCT